MRLRQLAEHSALHSRLLSPDRECSLRVQQKPAGGVCCKTANNMPLRMCISVSAHLAVWRKADTYLPAGTTPSRAVSYTTLLAARCLLSRLLPAVSVMQLMGLSHSLCAPQDRTPAAQGAFKSPIWMCIKLAVHQAAVMVTLHTHTHTHTHTHSRVLQTGRQSPALASSWAPWRHPITARCRHTRQPRTRRTASRPSQAQAQLARMPASSPRRPSTRRPPTRTSCCTLRTPAHGSWRRWMAHPARSQTCPPPGGELGPASAPRSRQSCTRHKALGSNCSEHMLQACIPLGMECSLPERWQLHWCRQHQERQDPGTATRLPSIAYQSQYSRDMGARELCSSLRQTHPAALGQSLGRSLQAEDVPLMVSLPHCFESCSHAICRLQTCLP